MVARMDARGAEGVEAALDGAESYREAGADIPFVEAPRSREETGALVCRLGNGAPLVADMAGGGRTPPAGAAVPQALGCSLAIFPGGAVRALPGGAVFGFGGLQELIGTGASLAAGRRCDGATD
jgi:2-methylisocitrate lyase-like PEP mutase family enzyme